MRELVWMRYLNALNTLAGSLVAVAVPVSVFSYFVLVAFPCYRELKLLGWRQPSLAVCWPNVRLSAFFLQDITVFSSLFLNASVLAGRQERA